MFGRVFTTLSVLIAAACANTAACAEPDLISPDVFTGVLDLRAAAVDGEAGWLNKGMGKLRYGDGGAGAGHVDMADAALAWRPRLTWDISAVVDGEVQHTDGYHADLIQAYLAYKPVPHGGTRYSARIGLFYPQISEEHEGPTWAVADTITPSAINTWVGEEVKVVGAEGTVSHMFGGHELALTGAVFGYDDTSGTLLTFRGWAMHDIKAGALSQFALPTVERQYLIGQPPETYSLREIDNRLGYYGRVDWRPPGRVSFNAFYYDNRGNLVGVDHQHQWAWATRFWNFGAVWKPDDRTKILSQVMTGETLMGFPTARSVWFNLGYTSAYVSATRAFGKGAVTGRFDWFETRDRNYRPATDDLDENWGEKGWALTAAWRYTLSPHATLLLEALHIESNRPTRLQQNVAQIQGQNQVQSAVRLSF